MLGQVRSGQVRSGQVRSGQVRSPNLSLIISISSNLKFLFISLINSNGSPSKLTWEEFQDIEIY